MTEPMKIFESNPEMQELAQKYEKGSRDYSRYRKQTQAQIDAAKKDRYALLGDAISDTSDLLETRALTKNHRFQIIMRLNQMKAERSLLHDQLFHTGEAKTG